MKVGTGHQILPSSFENGQAVAREALDDGDISEPQFVLAFCTGALDHDAFYAGLRSVLDPSVPIVGGSAIGVMTRTGLTHDAPAGGAAIIESSALRWYVAGADALNAGEYAAGQKIGERLPHPSDAQAILLFYDSLNKAATTGSPPRMNASPPLVAGIESVRHAQLPIIGAGLLGDNSFTKSIQFSGDHVGTQRAVGALLCGDTRVYTRISHGCTPHDGSYHTVTRSDGAIIYELDNIPIVETIDALYGNRDWQNQVPVRRLTIGVNKGDKFAPYREDNFINRLIVGVLPDRSGVVMFEPDLPIGTEILFMLRDPEEMLRSAKESARAIFEQIATDGRRPTLGLYIDCGGRAAIESFTATEEAATIIDAFERQDTPLLGFYSGVEIAPFQGANRGLDWTGVLMVLTDGPRVA